MNLEAKVVQFNKKYPVGSVFRYYGDNVFEVSTQAYLSKERVVAGFYGVGVLDITDVQCLN